MRKDYYEQDDLEEINKNLKSEGEYGTTEVWDDDESYYASPYKDYTDYELEVVLTLKKKIVVSAKSLQTAMDFVNQFHIDKIDMEKGEIDTYKKELKLAEGAEPDGDITGDYDYLVPLWWYKEQEDNREVLI